MIGKKNILILCLIAVSIICFSVLIISKKDEALPKEENIEIVFSERSEKFYISGGETTPVFNKELIVDPFKVKEGEKQYFSVWANDPDGIEKVTAEISTDKGKELIQLKLVEGTIQEGRWLGYWITKDISEKDSYQTLFKAKNLEGKEAIISITWQIEK